MNECLDGSNLSTGLEVTLLMLIPDDQDGLKDLEKILSYRKPTELWQVLHNSTSTINVKATLPVFKIKKSTL